MKIIFWNLIGGVSCNLLKFVIGMVISFSGYCTCDIRVVKNIAC